MGVNVKHGWVGVDLGVGAVKIAQVARRRSHWELLDAVIVQRREPWSVTAEALATGQGSAEEIGGGLSLSEQIKGRRAVGVLSMRPCEYHALRLEEGQLTRDGVDRELSAVDPQSWQERTFDAWQISHSSDPPGRPIPNVGVVSLPTAWADRAAADMASAGLDCRQVDALPTSLARALELMTGPQDLNLVALDWGYSRATLCIVRDGLPLYVRCLKQSAYGDVVTGVASTLSCSHDDATVLLRKWGLGKTTREDDLGRVIHDVLLPFVERLKSEIKRTLDYVQSHRRNLAPAGLVLFGTGATLAGVAPWLADGLDLKVLKWQPDPEILKIPEDLAYPVELLAPAVAASAMAWEKS